MIFDQVMVMGLTALKIPAGMLTSTTSTENEKSIYKALEKGEGSLRFCM
jgi:ATP-dependent DNA helicase Q1